MFIQVPIRITKLVVGHLHDINYIILSHIYETTSKHYYLFFFSFRLQTRLPKTLEPSYEDS